MLLFVCFHSREIFHEKAEINAALHIEKVLTSMRPQSILPWPAPASSALKYNTLRTLEGFSPIASQGMN